MRAREGLIAPNPSSMAALVLWIACAACLLVLSSGCQRQHCPGCTEPNPFTVSGEGSVSCPYQVSHLGPKYQNGTITDPTLLVLSGGASHGAWGAGVITGWPDASVSPTEPRPNFTVVTGISVGALQATPAFLGEPYDPLLEEFFTTYQDSDIFTSPNLLASNALQSREPLRQKIYAKVTEALVLEVASSPNKDRELYVGTVNLDTSQFCPWNLSTIARNAQSAPTGSDTRKCYVDLFRDVIFAASGAPVIAPPVEIDSNACKGLLPKKMLHADGGVRARVFVADAVKPAIDAGLTPTLYVIMNGKLVTHPECVENSLLPIALRTFEMMDHEALFGSLYALMYQHPSSIKLKLSRIPNSYCLRFPSSKFDTHLMGCLYRKGEAWVEQQPIPWETAVPTQSVDVWPQSTPPCCRPMGKCTGQFCVSPADCPP